MWAVFVTTVYLMAISPSGLPIFTGEQGLAVPADGTVLRSEQECKNWLAKNDQFFQEAARQLAAKVTAECVLAPHQEV